MRGNDGFIIVCSIANAKSFEEVDDFYQQILRVKDVERFPMILVANKIDLEDQREVEATSIEAYCKQNGLKYFNSSALKRINIDEPFIELVREVRNYKNKKNTPVVTKTEEVKVEDKKDGSEEKTKKPKPEKKKGGCIIL
jgi:GTPase KRas